MGKNKVKHEGWRLSAAERRNYYLGSFAEYMGGAIMTSFYSIYLMFQGVDLKKIAVLLLVVKCIDAVDDVVFGFLLDKIHLQDSRLFKKLAGDGRYISWYRCFFWLFPLATIIFFCMPTGLPEAAKMVWFFVGYLLYDLTYTIVSTPRAALIMTLTDSLDERGVLLQNSVVWTTIGGVVLGVGWPYLISEHVGFSVTSVAVVSMIVMFVMMIPLALKGKEYNSSMKNVDEKEEEKYTFKDMVNCVKTNKYIAILLFSMIATAITSTGSAIGNFIAYYRFNNSMVLTFPTLIAMIPALLIMGNLNKIIQKIGKRKAMVICMLLNGACDVILFFVPGSAIAVCVAIMSVTYLFGVMKSTINGFVIPDTIEYTKYKTGKDCAGIFNALSTFVNKATASVSGSVGMFILGLSGWVAITATDFADLAAQNVQQPASALTMMWALNTLIPALGCFISMFTVMFYNLKESDVQLMAKCNSGAITREECEAQLSRKY